MSVLGKERKLPLELLAIGASWMLQTLTLFREPVKRYFDVAAIEQTALS